MVKMIITFGKEIPKKQVIMKCFSPDRVQDIAERHSAFCFSSDSKVAVAAFALPDILQGSQIIDLVSGYHKGVLFNPRDSNFKLFCINKYRVVIASSQHCINILDIDSGATLESSFQGYLTEELVMQTKLSPNETILAFPTIDGDVEFYRLSIAQDPLLSSIKSKAAIEWRIFMKVREIFSSCQIQAMNCLYRTTIHPPKMKSRIVKFEFF